MSPLCVGVSRVMTTTTVGDGDSDCETGEVGEIWVRTPQNMLGY
jgi:long-subunit acyl-CoA synthetase (AMP-forming)